MGNIGLAPHPQTNGCQPVENTEVMEDADAEAGAEIKEEDEG